MRSAKCRICMLQFSETLTGRCSWPVHSYVSLLSNMHPGRHSCRAMFGTMRTTVVHCQASAGVSAHPSPSVVHDTLISAGEPVRARWTCRNGRT